MPETFCPKCGREALPSDQFCSGCGAAVRAQRPPMPPGGRASIPAGEGSNFWHSKKAVVLILGAVLLLMVLVGGALKNGSGDEGAVAAVPCMKAVDAGHEYMGGSRSGASLLSTLSDQERDERNSAAADPKYTPIVEMIVQMEEQVRSGSTLTALYALDEQCGTARRNAAP